MSGTTKFIAYYRVSTSGQGVSGLGLEAQRSAVERYVKGLGGEILKEFQEVESGRVTQRPQLDMALAACRRDRAVLVIARLDRLARNLYLIASLMESRIEFVAADMPTANKLTIHLLAAMAEHERENIARNTKAALRAAKQRGVVLGNPRLDQVRAKGTRATVKNADDFAERFLRLVNELQLVGLPYQKIADVLNARGYETQRKRSWTAAGVRNICIRLRANGLMP
ncbi:recombinase family protein [Pseudomarimonas salicorniae]|uniref:Recombinase family protein n=1 Tax=Pseudomarimonas salicorniae TaxID=2933270 RepID=A0ABT0GG46_9GAMM|nr:recombinase family protein [Lysobacter sp. CAU 1642]MCK7593513.1 recombinase family protein [Lysobacter sp. CAU 1642]